MQEGHGPGRDPALEAVAHHQLGPAAKLPQHGVEPLEVIGIVGVAHDHIATAGGADAAHQRGPIAAVHHPDHAGAGRLGQGLRAVGRAVVGHQHLTGHAGAGQEAPGLGDTDLQGLRLVEAGHEDGELEARRARRGPGRTLVLLPNRHVHGSSR